MKTNQTENYSTRISQAPDWLVSGLARTAAFARESPDEPMFNTGITYNQLRTRIRERLKASGLNLTTQELGSAVYRLSEYTADNISDTDTAESLKAVESRFVFSYLADKARQRQTGVSERSPIYTREEYDRMTMPPADTLPEPQTPTPEPPPPDLGHDAAADGKLLVTARADPFWNSVLEDLISVEDRGTISSEPMGTTLARPEVRAFLAYVREAAGGPAAPQFPGQTVLPVNQHQRAPHKRTDWQNTEDYNRDSVDQRKTDVQYIGGNVSTDAPQFNGGDSGNPIYVP